MTTIAHDRPSRVTVGVDTHLDVHVAVALDELGRRLDALSVPTTSRGYERLVTWAERLGKVEVFGVEGTGCYGAGLARTLLPRNYQVIEVIRPNRQVRRRRGKSDLTDAEAAARAVQSGEASSVAKSGDHLVEIIRVLRIARVTCVKARTQAINAIRSLTVSAPLMLRDQLRGLSSAGLIETAGRFRPGSGLTTVAATKTAMRILARRYQALDSECAELDQRLAELTAEAAPQLLSRVGVGPDVAGALLVAAGDNPERLHSEAAFSMMCGSSPVPASSGKTIRHRLNRGGNRSANAALHRIVLVRMRHHQSTRDYVERRTKEGKTKREIMRCLKRYVAREVYAVLSERAGDDRTCAL